MGMGTLSRTGPGTPLQGVSSDCLGEEPRPPLGWRARCCRPLVRALLLVSGVGTEAPLQSTGPSPWGWRPRRSTLPRPCLSSSGDATSGEKPHPSQLCPAQNTGTGAQAGVGEHWRFLGDQLTGSPSWEPTSGTSPSRGSKPHCPAETDPADRSCWALLGSAQCRPPQGNRCVGSFAAGQPGSALPCTCKGPLPKATHTQAALSLAPEASLCLPWPERPSSATNS